MIITGNSKIKDVLACGEEKMIKTLTWLEPRFERLRYPRLRRAMAGRVNVAQAARIARIPLTEILYVLNLAIGANEAQLAEELTLLRREDFEFTDANLAAKPEEINSKSDNDDDVVFVDLMDHADQKRDPMPDILKALANLTRKSDILLLRHPFDPIPLRDLLARKGFASWAEERRTGEWFIYFYRPAARTAASAHPSVACDVYTERFAAAA